MARFLDNNSLLKGNDNYFDFTNVKRTYLIVLRIKEDKFPVCLDGIKKPYKWNMYREDLQNYEFISIYLIYFYCPRYKTTPPIQDISMCFFGFVATFLYVG